MAAMISAIVTTLNDERRVGATLSALVPAAIEGLVGEVLFADGGSTDATAEIAEDAGAGLIVDGLGDHDRAFAAACERARGPWLLLLGAGSRLQPGWQAAARAHIEAYPGQAGWFRLSLERRGLGARWREAAAGVRGGWLARPGPEQGLLLSRALYDQVKGGLMSHAELVRRVGRERLRTLPARAVVD